MVKLKIKGVKWPTYNLTLELPDFEPNVISLVCWKMTPRAVLDTHDSRDSGAYFGVLLRGTRGGEGFFHFHTALSPLSNST